MLYPATPMKNHPPKEHEPLQHDAHVQTDAFYLKDMYARQDRLLHTFLAPAKAIGNIRSFIGLTLGGGRLEIDLDIAHEDSEKERIAIRDALLANAAIKEEEFDIWRIRQGENIKQKR